MDGEKDKQLKNILEDLNDDGKVETFNRKYFENNDMATPQNTPSAKKASEFSLKNVDFSKFLESRSDYNYESNPIRNEKEFCEPTYLGTTKQEIGYTKNVEAAKTCGNLLCTKCDVKVSLFKNMKWADNLEYMFFRNNYGDKSKLSEKLEASQGNICCSCQCSWINIQDDLVKVDSLSSVEWTCAGHKI